MANNDNCPGCGMSRDHWKGNRGNGFNREGRNYCCEGCAAGSGCTCA